MNEQTAKLIEQLSQKLGTTAEHLWGVLVRQAPISASTDFLTSMILGFLVCWSFRLVSKRTIETDDCPPQWIEEGAFLAWLFWGLFAIISVISIISSVELEIAGFANPEFWAFKHIVK